MSVKYLQQQELKQKKESSEKNGTKLKNSLTNNIFSLGVETR